MFEGDRNSSIGNSLLRRTATGDQDKNEDFLEVFDKADGASGGDGDDQENKSTFDTKGCLQPDFLQDFSTFFFSTDYTLFLSYN